MRILGLIVISAVVAACSQSVGGQAESSTAAASESPSGAPATTSSTGKPPPTISGPTQPPGEGAPIEDAIAWVEAGPPADPGAYHEAYLDGVTTRLGEDTAFTAPSGAPNATTQCITEEPYRSGAVTCLLDLDNPAPRPEGEGPWKAGWIDYAGPTMQVGSFHGDPGPLIKGSGPELTTGQSLAFGDYRCRSDATGVLCVNYAHRTAAWISASGVIPFGCLAPVTPPPPDAGAMFSC